ncbi:MAG: PAS domain S-box protein, partial [Anaerolineae bacterium]|nr:PAS domain S-box protein [Anaerolineae bacterium]
MNNVLCILLIDDSPDDRTLAIRELRREIPDLQVQQITEAKGFAQALEEGIFDLVITAYRLRWTDGLQVLHAVKARWSECPVIMFTGTGTEEIAVEAMKAGLDEYVIKSPRHFARLPVTVRLVLKRAQQRQALKEAEARYRNLFDGVPVGLYRTTPEGQALDANIALVQMLGYSNRESLLTINAADTYADPEDRQRWQVLMEREGVVRDFEAQLRRRDGTIIWVRDSAQAVRDSDGRVLYYEGVMEDITERKRTEEAFRRERDFSQSIVETTSALVMVLDADGRITLFNRACEELTGYTAAETIGCVMWKFLIPERFVPGVQEAFSKRLRADVPPGNYEIPLLTRDGNERWITWTYTNVRDEAGDVVAFVGIGVDVTDFRRVQQTLERRNRELQALVEAGQLLSGTLDLDEVLDRVLDVVQKQFNLASVSFSSYDPATQTFEIRAQHYDVPAHQVGRIGERRQRDQHPYSSRALDTGQLVYEPDLWNAPHIPEERQAEAQRLNIRSVVEVPLLAKGQPVGVLHMRSFGVPRFFTAEELAFARAIAPGAAAAIDNARLYGQIDAARARAEGLAARVVQAQEEERR